MSDKDWNKILEADRVLRLLFPAGPVNCPSHKTVLATIEVIGGFELFNTRPYHNYENWGQGYRITAEGVSVEAEDLDDVLRIWAQWRVQGYGETAPRHGVVTIAKGRSTLR